ncbi:MAG: prepilin-type N-terminal cleavage/methylation domain-containing protein [Candidatus Pacebacteria bacterium]|nr:prepilin-type N-terminal cleavage/methylation domain-containing protein [Candidatus Paceibacterota bacterium]
MLEKLKFNKIKERAFTLVEVFVAISVLSIGVVGSFGVLPVMIKNQAINTDTFIASRLANEGMELVRNLRDENWLKEQDWTAGLTNCPVGTGCEIDYNDPALSVNQNRFLKLDSDSFYKYDSGVNSKFKRKIITNKIDATTLNVKVEISWSGKGSPLMVEENFYDWR